MLVKFGIIFVITTLDSKNSGELKPPLAHPLSTTLPIVSQEYSRCDFQKLVVVDIIRSRD